MSVLAGPWVGEFGWELCWWNPHLRRLSCDIPSLVVAAPAGHEYLYEFAEYFIPCEVRPIEYHKGKLLEPLQLPTGVRITDRLTVPRMWRELGHREACFIDAPTYKPPPRLWRRFGSGPTANTDVVACAFRPVMKGRARKGMHMPEAWAVVRELRELGAEVVCIGGPDNLCPPDAADWRGWPLDLLCEELSQAMCVVGPSSAPVHLGALCGAPVVTWHVGRDDVQHRYRRHWNPNNVDVTWLGATEPSPQAIASAVIEVTT